MNLRNNFELLFVLLSCVLSYTNAQFRIIDGQDIDITESPHSVAILRNNGYECVGSLVSTKSVLTVAHCVVDIDLQSLSVLAGVTDINAEGGQRHCVEEIHRHPQYNPEIKFMDIAIVKVITPFELNDAVQKIELCNDRLVPGLWMQISGWGSLEKNKRTVSPLLKTKFVQIQQCRNGNANIPIPAHLAEITLYAGRSRKDLCFGDSGAAGVRNGRLCAVAQSIYRKRNRPCVYVDVTNPSVLNFITTTINNDDEVLLSVDCLIGISP